MAKRDIDFLFEIGSLRNLPRAWQQALGGKVQNVSEHIFRVTLIAWIIAIEEKANVEKVLKICLIHDLSESRSTDIAFLHREYITRHEDLAEKHVFQETSLEKESKILLEEYNKRVSIEARIVKDADNLDCDLELAELAKLGNSTALDMIKNSRPLIRENKLYTKTAKKMWDQINKSDPDDWHKSLVKNWIKHPKGAK